MAKAIKKKKSKPKKEAHLKLNISFEEAIQMSFAPKTKSKK